jgi:hypothetical protein
MVQINQKQEEEKIMFFNMSLFSLVNTMIQMVALPIILMVKLFRLLNK